MDQDFVVDGTAACYGFGYGVRMHQQRMRRVVGHRYSRPRWLRVRRQEK